MSQAHEIKPNQGLSPLAGESRQVQELVASFDVLPPLLQVFSLSGRMNRMTFALVQLFLILTAAMVAATFEAILSNGLQDLLTIATPLVRTHARPDLIRFFDSIGGGDPLRILMAVVCFLAWYVLGLSVTVRRLHDIGHSGWTVIPLNLASAIPYIGWVFALLPFAVPGEAGANDYGDPPKPTHFMARVRRVPRHIWRGETPLPNMLLFYVFFLNFLVLDKAGTTLTASLDLSTVNLLFIGALILLNCALAIGVWRSAIISDANVAWRFLAKLVAVFLVTRVVLTLASLLIVESV